MAAELRGSLEENVMAALCHNEECANEIALMVTPEMFDSEGMKLLARRGLDYVHKYNAPPKQHMRDLFEKELRSESDSGRMYRRIFDEIDRIGKDIQATYVLDQLTTFIEATRLRDVLKTAQDALNALDLDGAKLAMTAPEIQVSYSAGTWAHKPEEMLRFLNKANDDELYSSGIQELDARSVRPTRKTLTVLIAPPKAGKSWYLINQGKVNMARRKSVLHITCENSEELTAKRYIMSLFGMATHEINNLRLPYFKQTESGTTEIDFRELDKDPDIVNDSQRAALTAKLRQLETRPRLLIKEFPSGTLTVPMIAAFMDMLERTDSFKPDLLIVDYPKQMRLDTRTYRIDLGRIMIELRGLAGSRNIAISTVMQGNKSSKTAHVVAATMVSEDYSIIGTADTILTYSQTPEEEKINLARILVDSARDAKDSYLVMISQSYVTGQFCLDSVYMTQHLEQGIDRFTGGPSKREAAEDINDDEPML
jgi:hypothetical protein